MNYHKYAKPTNSGVIITNKLNNYQLVDYLLCNISILIYLFIYSVKNLSFFKYCFDGT